MKKKPRRPSRLHIRKGANDDFIDTQIFDCSNYLFRAAIDWGRIEDVDKVIKFLKRYRKWAKAREVH